VVWAPAPGRPAGQNKLSVENIRRGGIFPVADGQFFFQVYLFVFGELKF